MKTYRAVIEIISSTESGRLQSGLFVDRPMGPDRDWIASVYVRALSAEDAIGRVGEFLQGAVKSWSLEIEFEEVPDLHCWSLDFENLVRNGDLEALESGKVVFGSML